MRNARRQGQRGNAFIETSLVLLPFVALVLGTADMARVMFVHHSLHERVRSITRTAAIQGHSEEQVRNLIVYGSMNLPDSGVAVRGFEGLQPNNVQVTYSDAGTNSRRVQVRVSGMPVQLLTPGMSQLVSNIPVTITLPLETP